MIDDDLPLRWLPLESYSRTTLLIVLGAPGWLSMSPWLSLIFLITVCLIHVAQ